MKRAISYGVRDARVQAVVDDGYAATLHSIVSRARRRCLCSMFMIDLAPARDRKLRVDDVLIGLRDARWRGADVRLLVGGSRINVDMAELADTARGRALELGIPCRWLTSQKVRGSHAKIVVADDMVLLGSHNWSDASFTTETQDSVLVESADLAALMAVYFDEQWTRVPEEKSRVSI